MVVTEHLVKMSCFIATKKTIDAYNCAELLINDVICRRGIPDKIVSDRNKLFTSELWDRLHQRLRITLRFTTSYNPSSNGQVEWTKGTMIDIIHTLVRSIPQDWPLYLPMAEFSSNNSYYETIGLLQFYANYGYHPRIPEFINKLVGKSIMDTQSMIAGSQRSHFEYHLEILQSIWKISQQKNGRIPRRPLYPI